MPEPGAEIAGHRLVRQVGEGGMGVVFEAEDRSGLHVAMKLLRPKLALDESAVLNFRNEAEATGAVDHENVVTILGQGEADGFHYIVMEFVDGPPLHHHIRDRKLPWKDATEIAVQVARALGCAHGMGLIHRDVKPENVLLFEDRRARLTDFGIVKDISSLRGFLLKGQQVGTAAYASPEQCQGKRLSAATDMYSLGATLYRMVCGRHVFTGDSHNVVMNKHVKAKPIPPIQLERDLPKPLSHAIERMLAKSPTERFPTMERLVDDLVPIIEGRIAMPGATRRSGRSAPRRPRPARRPRESEKAAPEEKPGISADTIILIAVLALAAVLVILALSS